MTMVNSYDNFEQQIVALRTLASSVMDGIQHDQSLGHKNKAALQSFLSTALDVISDQAKAMHRLEIERHVKEGQTVQPAQAGRAA